MRNPKSFFQSGVSRRRSGFLVHLAHHPEQAAARALMNMVMMMDSTLAAKSGSVALEWCLLLTEHSSLEPQYREISQPLLGLMHQVDAPG